MVPFKPSQVRVMRDTDGRLVRNPRAAIRLLPHRVVSEDMEQPRNYFAQNRLMPHKVRRACVRSYRTLGQTKRRNQRV